MSKQTKNSSVERVIDANINRVKEGLRVCEEVTRFILNSRSLTLELKTLRHEIDSVVKGLVPKKELLRERSLREDVGRNICGNELKRGSIKDIFFANIQRVKESIRVLEEFSKLIDTKAALNFKKTRYKIYQFEKKAVERFPGIE